MSTSRYALVFLLLAVQGCVLAAGPPTKARAREFERLPNWTGQWEIVGVTPTADGGIAESLDEVLRSMQQWGPPPYKPEVKGAMDKLMADIRKVSIEIGAGAADPTLVRPICTFGFPALMIQSPLMFEILTTPEETAMIFSGREIRHIYTDGRPHTPNDDLWPTPWGDSIGHWDRQTLVIDTIAVNGGPGGQLPPAIVAFGGGSNADFAMVAAFSPNARFSERIRMVDVDHLENQMTIIDPTVLTAPWRISRRYSRVMRLNRMVHEDCEGEDRNPIVDGHYTLTPPPPSRLPPSSPMP